MRRRISFLLLCLAICFPARADFDARRTDNDRQRLHAVNDEFRRYALARQQQMLALEEGAPSPAGTPSQKDAEGRPRWFDGQGGVDALQAMSAPLVDQSKFENIERVAAQYRDEGAQAADGRSLYPIFCYVISQLVDARPSPDDFLREWRRKIPRSSIAAAMAAERIYRAAWKARGSGFADTVKPEQWARFYELVGQADKTLEAARKYAARDPYWHQMKISTSFHLPHGERSYEQSLKNAVTATRYDHSLYFGAVSDFTPKWGGSWQEVDAFARLAAAMTHDRDGDAFYARVYWYVAQSEYMPSGDIFKDTEVSWPLMKRGFEDLIARYPHSAWNLNAFAGFACVAGDEETLRSLWPKIGAFLIPRAWPPGSDVRGCVEKASGSPL